MRDLPRWRDGVDVLFALGGRGLGELVHFRIEKSRVLCGKKSAVWKLETLELRTLCFVAVGLSVAPSSLPFMELALARSWWRGDCGVSARSLADLVAEFSLSACRRPAPGL